MRPGTLPEPLHAYPVPDWLRVEHVVECLGREFVRSQPVHTAHTGVAPVVEERRPLPVVVVGLEQVPGDSER